MTLRTVTLRTRAQQDMALAARHMKGVQGKPKEAQQIYGGLCHQFPVMVRTVGLAQTLAFHLSKVKADGPDKAKVDSPDTMKKSRQTAHRLLLEHVAEVLKIGGEPLQCVTAVQDADVSTYMHHTRRVLTAWIYYKRFAVSLLDIQSAQSAEGPT